MADGRLEVFRRALLGRDFFAHVAPLRLRPGVASIIWESLVSIGGRSREHFADNRSAHYLFIYIDKRGGVRLTADQYGFCTVGTSVCVCVC